jgi:hypothetical protein
MLTHVQLVRFLAYVTPAAVVAVTGATVRSIVRHGTFPPLHTGPKSGFDLRKSLANMPSNGATPAKAPATAKMRPLKFSIPADRVVAFDFVI